MPIQSRPQSVDGTLPGDIAAAPQDEEALLRTPGSELAIRRMSDPVPLDRQIYLRNRLIEFNSEHSKVVQSFRNIRTLLMQQAQGNFVTLVASVRSGAGTSFVARNLAAAFAFDENRTAMLIDCNRDSPSVDQLLGGRVRYGLTDLLDAPENVNVADVIYGTGIPRLRAVPVGRKRQKPIEFFSTPRMRSFVEVIRNRYPDRYIVVDAPALDASADARILANWCDYVVLVVRYGEVSREELLEAVATFPREKFVGVVFNDFDIDTPRPSSSKALATRERHAQ